MVGSVVDPPTRPCPPFWMHRRGERANISFLRPGALRRWQVTNVGREEGAKRSGFGPLEAFSRLSVARLFSQSRPVDNSLFGATQEMDAGVRYVPGTTNLTIISGNY